MHVDMTAVKIQSNKTVLDEVNNNYALLEPSYGKKTNELFDQPSNLLQYSSTPLSTVQFTKF